MDKLGIKRAFGYYRLNYAGIGYFTPHGDTLWMSLYRPFNKW
jgi:hypothetical protein